MPDQARRTLLDVSPSSLPNYTAGTFPSGQLGLYTLSQPSTSFRFIGPRSSVCDAVCGDGILISGAEECDGAANCNQTTCKFSVDIHDEAVGAPDRFPEAISFTGTASPGAVVTMSVVGPNGAIAMPLGDRDITAGPDGTFTWTSPALTAIGVYTITASATDVAGGVITDSTTREIVDPLILQSDSLSVLGGSSDSVNILTNDWSHADTPITVTRIETTSVPGTQSLDANGLLAEPFRAPSRRPNSSLLQTDQLQTAFGCSRSPMILSRLRTRSKPT